MQKRIKLKICGLTQAENMRQIAAHGPDYFGFIFYPPSPRAVTSQQAAELPDCAGVQRVGVFVNETTDHMLEIAKQARLSLLQLHGDEAPETCAEIRRQAPHLQVIKVFPVGADFTGETLAGYQADCDFFLFDTLSAKRGGNGTAFDWEILHRFRHVRPFFLGGGLGPANAAQALVACAGLPLYALDLNSRAEIAPGLKSVSAVKLISSLLNT